MTIHELIEQYRQQGQQAGVQVVFAALLAEEENSENELLFACLTACLHIVSILTRFVQGDYPLSQGVEFIEKLMADCLDTLYSMRKREVYRQALAELASVSF